MALSVTRLSWLTTYAALFHTRSISWRLTVSPYAESASKQEYIFNEIDGWIFDINEQFQKYVLHDRKIVLFSNVHERCELNNQQCASGNLISKHYKLFIFITPKKWIELDFITPVTNISERSNQWSNQCQINVKSMSNLLCFNDCINEKRCTCIINALMLWNSTIN